MQQSHKIPESGEYDAESVIEVVKNTIKDVYSGDVEGMGDISGN